MGVARLGGRLADPVGAGGPSRDRVLCGAAAQAGVASVAEALLVAPDGRLEQLGGDEAAQVAVEKACKEQAVAKPRQYPWQADGRPEGNDRGDLTQVIKRGPGGCILARLHHLVRSGAGVRIIGAVGGRTTLHHLLQSKLTKRGVGISALGRLRLLGRRTTSEYALPGARLFARHSVSRATMARWLQGTLAGALRRLQDRARPSGGSDASRQ